MVRPLFGFLAETAEELRQLRRAIVSATAGGAFLGSNRRNKTEEVMRTEILTSLCLLAGWICAKERRQK